MQKERENVAIFASFYFLLSFFFCHSSLTIATSSPRSPSSLMRHWYLSEQGAQEQHLCLLPVGSLVISFL